MFMKRRKFLQVAGGTVAASALAAPAIAQSAPEIEVASDLELSESARHDLRRGRSAGEGYVSEATDGKFQIQVFAAGEIVPGLQALDAVSNGTVEMCHTANYYYVGKDPTFAFATAVPFGLNQRMMDAWCLYGGGNDLLNGFFAKHKVIGFMCGNTGCQMGGWYRKEIKTVEDLKGLKMRIGGFAGQVLTKLGVVPQQIAGGEIYQALERGTIDAAEWVGPYDDEKLGFAKVAPYYYYPGWWEGGPMLHAMVNLEKFNALPKHYKAIIEAAAQTANTHMMAKYDAGNPAALRRLIAGGAKLQPFSTANHGNLLQGRERSLRRDLGEERGLQEDPRLLHGVPERSVPVVAGCGILFRQFPDPRAPLV
jgi:TRAP-type mannitol/chloroaromatic compound transport system substrate-binding protein